MWRSLSVQLTFRFIALFALLFLSAFTLVYWHLNTTLHEKIDERISRDVYEIAETLRIEGLDEAIREVHLEADSEGISRVFIRLFSPEKKLITTSDLKAWPELNIRPREPASKTGQVYETLTMPGMKHQTRVLNQKLDGGYLIQMGFLLQEDNKLLEDFRDVFGIAFVTMLLGSAMTSFMVAKRTIRGLEKIRQTADRIGHGDFTHRISLDDDSEEIEELAQAFNQMQDKIEGLIGEMKDVTNNIAHDLRSPLTRIRGLAETTLTGTQDLAEYRDMAGAIVEESDRMVGMVNTMLEIAAVDAGIRKLPKTSVDLGDVIFDVGELFSTVAEDKGVELEVSATTKDLLFQGDRPQLQRALANLLDNAVKYTESGGKVIVRAKGVEDHILITISDTGIGISATEQEQIFNRFYRLDQSRSTPGCGLGLSLVKAVVKAHGGTVSVESAPGRGSCFAIKLPIDFELEQKTML